MPSDLENELVEGGISPAAAKVISNAIGNAASRRLSTGPQVTDGTPTSRMRMIDADARKYVFTNLDYDRTANRFAAIASSQSRHPYEASQPATGTPTLTTPAVKAGKFLASSSLTANEVAQSELTLRVSARGGTHARLNQGTGEIEAVPFLIEVEPKNKVEASVEERADATVLKLRFLQ
jgi:hypothetical protein